MQSKCECVKEQVHPFFWLSFPSTSVLTLTLIPGMGENACEHIHVHDGTGGSKVRAFFFSVAIPKREMELGPGDDFAT